MPRLWKKQQECLYLALRQLATKPQQILKQVPNKDSRPEEQKQRWGWESPFHHWLKAWHLGHWNESPSFSLWNIWLIPSSYCLPSEGVVRINELMLVEHGVLLWGTDLIITYNYFHLTSYITYLMEIARELKREKDKYSTRIRY